MLILSVFASNEIARLVHQARIANARSDIEEETAVDSSRQLYLKADDCFLDFDRPRRAVRGLFPPQRRASSTSIMNRSASGTRDAMESTPWSFSSFGKPYLPRDSQDQGPATGALHAGLQPWLVLIGRCIYNYYNQFYIKLNLSLYSYISIILYNILLFNCINTKIQPFFYT